MSAFVKGIDQRHSIPDTMTPVEIAVSNNYTKLSILNTGLDYFNAMDNQICIVLQARADVSSGSLSLVLHLPVAWLWWLFLQT